MIGGGQERGLRPGTLAVPLITGFEAAELSSGIILKERLSVLILEKRLLRLFHLEVL